MESLPSPTVYAPVGCCIYCGTTAGELTKEHIVPFGLGGNLILPKASCRDCATVTGGVEHFCLRPMLGPFRIRLALPTRRPEERPSALPIEFIRVDGRREQKTVGAQEVPLACIGFRLAAPGLLRGLPPTETLEGELVVRHLEDETRKHLSPEGQRVKLGTINMLTFSRMLAKIGHSYAVANLGLGSFRPLLPDLILGKSSTAPYLVGGDASTQPPATEPVLHHVYLQNCLTRGVEYVLVAIRLFAFVGMPRYHVVVGETVKC